MNKAKIIWDLSSIFKSDDDPVISKKRNEVIKETDKFVKKWEKRDDYLKDPKILKEALDEYEKWLHFFGADSQENYYFDLRHSLDQANPSIKAKQSQAEESGKNLQNEIQFFELRLAKIDPKTQKKFLAYKPLSVYKHFLVKLFEFAKYTLSEPEEKIMNLKGTTSHTNWVRMTSTFLAKEERKIIDEEGKKITKNFSEILGLMNSQKKKTRDSAADAFNDILKNNVEVAEHEINSVLQNKKINDELRGYDRPDKARHMEDDIDTEVVDSLVDAVTKNFDISKRFYKLKAALLGVPKLAYHERNVEYGKIDKTYSYEKAVEILDNVFGNLDKEFKNIFQGFVREGRIDVYPKKGKTSGAFCTYGLLIHPTFALLNWTDNLNDVLTFAHELGHGIHFELAKNAQNALNFGTTIATTEVASTFTEDFVLEQLKKDADDELRLSLMMMKLNDEASTIFRQVAFYAFEKELHSEFRKIGYLSKEAIGEIFQKHMISYMGDYVEQSKGSENWWTYVGHFRNFFYVYSYASGLLISKSLQASVKKDPKFILKVKDFLKAGVSDSPRNIFMKLGVDITNGKFWYTGLSEVATLLQQTEDLAKRLGKI